MDSAFDYISNAFNCGLCRMGDKDACMKCKITEGFSYLRSVETKNIIIILIIIAILIYTDIIPNPFKSKVSKQHLQYFFF
jgi:hypothetical protein